jgi:DNA-binding Lrp family transcriptional regulator
MPVVPGTRFNERVRKSTTSDPRGSVRVTREPGTTSVERKPLFHERATTWYCMNETRRTLTNLDETDLSILERVEDDFDVSLETLAEELDLSKSAVHYRLNNLKESGVIRGITADVDPLAFGLELVAITDVSVTHEAGYSEEVGQELMSLQGVEQVYYTMGDVDFVVISRIQTRDQLNDLIDRIVALDGVNETSSKFVMEEFDNERTVTDNLTEQARETVLEPSE